MRKRTSRIFPDGKTECYEVYAPFADGWQYCDAIYKFDENSNLTCLWKKYDDVSDYIKVTAYIVKVDHNTCENGKTYALVQFYRDGTAVYDYGIAYLDEENERFVVINHLEDSTGSYYEFYTTCYGIVLTQYRMQYGNASTLKFVKNLYARTYDVEDPYAELDFQKAENVDYSKEFYRDESVYDSRGTFFTRDGMHKPVSIYDEDLQQKINIYALYNNGEVLAYSKVKKVNEKGEYYYDYNEAYPSFSNFRIGDVYSHNIGPGRKTPEFYYKDGDLIYKYERDDEIFRTGQYDGEYDEYSEGYFGQEFYYTGDFPYRKKIHQYIAYEKRGGSSLSFYFTWTNHIVDENGNHKRDTNSFSAIFSMINSGYIGSDIFEDRMMNKEIIGIWRTENYAVLVFYDSVYVGKKLIVDGIVFDQYNMMDKVDCEYNEDSFGGAFECNEKLYYIMSNNTSDYHYTAYKKMINPYDATDTGIPIYKKRGF